MHPRHPLHPPTLPGRGSRETRPFHRVRSVAGVLTASMLLGLAGSACGSSAAAPTASAAGAATAAGETAPAAGQPSEAAAEPSAIASTVEVEGEAWFAGFHVTFGTATAELEAGRGGTVTIDAEFENLGDAEATLDATLDLANGGEHAEVAFGMDLPSVPGGTMADGTLAFLVDDGFTFDGAVLTLGRSGNQQAVVPLAPGAGDAVTQEPVALDLSGSATAGDLRLDLDGGEYRADQPWSHGQMEDGTFVLTLEYDATFESDFAGGFAFAGENVALRLPDGTTVGVIQDGRSQSIELIGPASTVKDLYSRFEIEEPATGDYVLLVRSFDAEAEIPFSIP